jgi:cytidylate kinase
MQNDGEKVVAIDGPAASGKSTVARRVAAAVGFLYVDSGALYRAITWKALNDGVPVDSESAVLLLLERMEMKFLVADGRVRFSVDGDDPADGIRSMAVNENVSKIAAIPAVRRQVNIWLRDMLRLGALVVEGRDIGTAVFPGARWKFYLDADPEERARRRHAETVGKLPGIDAEMIRSGLRRRDDQDSRRKMDPLRTASDAAIIDTTNMTIDDVVSTVVGQVKTVAR